MKKRPEKTPEKGKQMARKEVVSTLRQILVRRRDALRRALAGDLNSLKELRQQTSGDMLDAAMDTAQDEINSQLAEVESRELSHIEVALERMRDGNYGLCEGCGEGIPMARLQALPYATMCIQCQREAEKSGNSLGSGANWQRILDVGMAESEVSAGDLELD
ncbi:MAG: TraR/DksA family transcriptional regulator [Pirellulaceae bacterium]